MKIIQNDFEHLVVNNKDIECLCVGTNGLIVAPGNVMFLKLKYHISFKTIKFPRGNYQPIVSRQNGQIALEGQSIVPKSIIHHDLFL